jgi:phosphoribosylaminoimidazole-succinocarboxamide synthase
VDTKYEFGKTKEGVIVLIDEIHTPDSSHILYRRISGKAG